jgi:hypothetical protein
MLYLEALPHWEGSGGVLYLVTPHCPYVGPLEYVLCKKHKGNIHPITGHEGPDGK